MARNRKRISTAAPAQYRIEVEGCLDTEFSAWLGGLEVHPDTERQTTVLTGILPDQAALRGVLDSLDNMQVPLMRVERVDSVGEDKG